MNKHTRTDWARLAQQTDDDIDTSDIPPITEQFFARAKLLIPPMPSPIVPCASHRGTWHLILSVYTAIEVEGWVSF